MKTTAEVYEQAEGGNVDRFDGVRPREQPFIAESDDTTAITGIGLLEGGQAALDEITSGGWVEAGLGVVGIGLETPAV